VISPYTEPGAVVHNRYDELSFLRTLEIIVGMKPLNLSEALAVLLYGAFTSSPVNTAPYDAITPNVSVMATNPNTAADRKASEGLNLNVPDQMPERQLDAILWHYVHGADSTPPPPGPNASASDTASADAADYAPLAHSQTLLQSLRGWLKP
jgi:hypothetical protein